MILGSLAWILASFLWRSNGAFAVGLFVALESSFTKCLVSRFLVGWLLSSIQPASFFFRRSGLDSRRSATHGFILATLCGLEIAARVNRLRQKSFRMPTSTSAAEAGSFQGSDRFRVFCKPKGVLCYGPFETQSSLYGLRSDALRLKAPFISGSYSTPEGVP